jgi:hypothetical protein
LYNLRILVEDSFVVILAIKSYFKLRAAFNKRARLVYANLVYISLSVQGIGYISYSCEPRRKSSHNKLKYILYNYLLFKLV